MALNSPFTTWEGDELHGRWPVLTGVWVQLDRLFVRNPDAPRHVIETGWTSPAGFKDVSTGVSPA